MSEDNLAPNILLRSARRWWCVARALEGFQFLVIMLFILLLATLF